MLAIAFTGVAAGHHVGNNYWLILGPVIIGLSLLVWIGLTRYASGKRVRSQRLRGGSSDRGPVKGGIIEGSPAQRTRRDPAVPEDYKDRAQH
ncbi:hypothetical protein [Actinomadura rupiterrae]|uniref:hypothetical protein n=1 Tax=Actinomadura rupiterrae TaxID=559627 RepID=UPI0020A4B41B|nr:hypothetical protein [Actinomadura rupiterrae]MCP2337257.1 hypothetical protein [Actinomadura rupiterrae]